MRNCVGKFLIQNWNRLLLRMLAGLESIWPEFISNSADFGLSQFYPLVVSTLNMENSVAFLLAFYNVGC